MKGYLKTNAALIFFRTHRRWSVYNYISTDSFTLTKTELQLLADCAEWRRAATVLPAKVAASLLKRNLLQHSMTRNPTGTASLLPDAAHWNVQDLWFHRFQHGPLDAAGIKPSDATSRPSIILPQVHDGDSAAARLLRQRRSTRKFSKEPLPLEQLSALLQVLYSTGRFTAADDTLYGPNTSEESTVTIGKKKFSFPLGGAFNTFDHLIAVNAVTGLAADTIYRYDAAKHRLNKLADVAMAGLCRDVFLRAEWPMEAAAILIIATTPSKRKHYRNTYKMALVEAGHILQSLYLLACEMDLAVCEMGGIDESKLIGLLNPQGAYQTVPVAAIAIGLKQ